MKVNSTREVFEWLNLKKLESTYEVSHVLLTELLKWKFSLKATELYHETRGFFSVKGLFVQNDAFAAKEIMQPILNQPEKGMLGFIRTIIQDKLYYLVQAKFEPGNPDLIQLSPTVQATVCNYSQIHGGLKTKYIEYFLKPDEFPYNLFLKYELTETASRFYGKTNYNCIIELPKENIKIYENFILIEEDCLKEIMLFDNIINMNARSILSIAFNTNVFKKKSSETEIWLDSLRKNFPTRRGFKIFKDLENWNFSDNEIVSDGEPGFQITGLNVKAKREVREWFQPILRNKNLGHYALFSGLVDNEIKYLIHAYPEVGTLMDWEIGPTIVQLDDFSRLETHLSVDDKSIKKEFRYSVKHSEEGGRFYQNINKYDFYNVNPKKIEASKLYRWVTFAELLSLNEIKGAVTSELRTMIAILSSSKS